MQHVEVEIDCPMLLETLLAVFLQSSQIDHILQMSKRKLLKENVLWFTFLFIYFCNKAKVIDFTRAVIPYF